MPEPTDASSTCVETRGSFLDGSLRFRATCCCGWSTGVLLTAMQAHHALEDHACRPRPSGDSVDDASGGGS